MIDGQYGIDGYIYSKMEDIKPGPGEDYFAKFSPVIRYDTSSIQYCGQKNGSPNEY